MSVQSLFPQPQHLDLLPGTVDLVGRAVELTTRGALPPLAQRALDLAQADLPSYGVALASAKPAYTITVQIELNHVAWAQSQGQPEAYLLELREQEGVFVAASAAGLFAGCQTLRQLFLDAPAQLPALRIVDWPDFRYRGLYIESKWGPDLMTLADWKACIDYMAALKFNSLGIGVYGCWVVQYESQTTEFMMLPFPNHPTLKTPKTLRYYSPAAQAWQTFDYLPSMVTADFFGELVAYAKANNITVRPHFNAPGHNTLIPRAYPEVSAQYADGSPIGYGFCLSNPRSFELLFELYDSVIDRYLRPSGIDWFHIGLDEVTGYMGIDPQRPFEVTDPWCRCPQCRDKPHAQQLQEYAVKVCAHLKQQGINHITLWNDALSSLGALNDQFVEMLDAAGVRDNVVLQWWRYQEPTLIPPRDLGLRAWVTPMAGYWSNLFTQSYTANIYPMLLYGHRAGAEGADAYCIYDPAFDRNYVCLAQYAWNQTNSEDLYQFKSRYAQARLGRWLDPALAAEAFAKYDQAFDAMAWTETTLDSLLYYWHTYPNARKRGHYPFSVITDLLDEHLRLRNAIQRLVAHARAARDLFAQANTKANDPLLEQYRVECDKLIGIWSTFSLLLKAVDQYQQAQHHNQAALTHLTQAAELVSNASAALRLVLADLERRKAPYLRPQILRDLSILLAYLEQLHTELAEQGVALKSGTRQALPPFAALRINQVEIETRVEARI